MYDVYIRNMKKKLTQKTETKTSIISVIDYTKHSLEELRIKHIDDCARFKKMGSKSWIHVFGARKTPTLEKMGELFGIHPIILDDINNTDQRPKLENHGTYLYTVLKLVSYNASQQRIGIEQISMILSKSFLITFQEKEEDVFHSIKERIRTEDAKIRKMPMDYLFYSLMDAVVDHYFIVLEQLGERVTHLETQVLKQPSQKTMKAIHNLKRDMILLRKSIWPLREVVSNLRREESSLISDETDLYLKDIYDHTIQAIETAETFSDMLSSLLDLYLSTMSHKMNEVMKVLTIIATIFIPLTFLTGLYGMNFQYMPELDWEFGYPLALGIMFGVAVFMIIYFKRKNWF